MKTFVRSILCIALGGAFFVAGTGPAAARSRTLKPVITKGKPAIEFSGSITEVNATARQITVSGSSNDEKKDAPTGTVVFNVSPSCFIKSSTGQSGSFNDLQSGKSVAISYALEANKHYGARSIRLDPAEPAADTPTKKKK